MVECLDMNKKDGKKKKTKKKEQKDPNLLEVSVQDTVTGRAVYGPSKK